MRQPMQQSPAVTGGQDQTLSKRHGDQKYFLLRDTFSFLDAD